MPRAQARHILVSTAEQCEDIKQQIANALHLQRFIDLVGQLECQLVLTSLHPHFDLFGRAERVFHVEQERRPWSTCGRAIRA